MTARERDHGYATLFTASIALVLVLAATVALTVVAVVLAAHRARSAADLAALAAATAEVAGLDPCDAARTSARSNRSRVTTCRVSGQSASFVVTVTTVVDTGLRAPLPADVAAVASAGNAY